jgi:hypothetical protein
MTCARFENDLALYVERDLPEAAVPAVEAHLRECAQCVAFLADLRASQSLVQGLAAEPIGEEALADLRGRVIAAASSPAPSRDHRSLPVLWAAAAAVVVGVGAWVWMARGGGQELREPPVVQEATATTEPSRPQRPTRLGSTAPAMRGVSHDANSGRVVRARVTRAAVVPVLSHDDADQLARAVVAVSQVLSAHDRPPVVDPSPEREVESAPLMRLASTDPNVVIYWQLEPNGGE